MATIVQGQDITGRKNVEEALQESEKKYRELVQNVNSNILGYDTNKKITFFNEYAQRFFGYREEEIIGKDVNILVPKTDSTGKSLETLMDDILKDPEGFRANINENILRSGERVWISWTNRAILDSDGRVAGILCVGQDITGLKRAEKALQKSEARYRAIVEDLTTLICRFLPDGTLTFVNDAYCRYFGMKREELIGHSFLPHMPDEDHEKVKMKLTSLSRELPVVTYEHRVIVNGEVRWMEWTEHAIFDENGSLLEIQSVGTRHYR